MKIKSPTTLAALIALAIPQLLVAKPKIWIHTDLTAAATTYDVTSTTSKAVTDQGSDQDDHVALAIYLMLANKFETKRIVLGVTNRDTRNNPADFFNNVFRPAYEADRAGMNARASGYPTAESFLVSESSLTKDRLTDSFSNSPADKYDNINNLPATVKLLVEELKTGPYTASDPLYVCVWGPLSEVAMATKHLIRKAAAGDTASSDALKRLYVVSHWTSSFLLQAPANDAFDVANCNTDGPACDYMHTEAKKSGAAFKFVDLGSIGQGGIVNGYGKPGSPGNNVDWFAGGLNGTRAKQFRNSKLGDLFIKSKFVSGKPDGSDCATFYAILDTYGVKLSDFNSNGELTKPDESDGTNAFKAKAHSMLDELLAISDAASNTSGGGGGALPSGWSSGDIGSVAAAGSATFSDSTYTVKGSGAAIWGSADEFFFVRQSASGDCEIKARVASQQNTNAYALAGVMIREGTGAGSKHAFMSLTPTNGSRLRSRTTASGTTTQNTNNDGAAAPYWVRLVRSGNTFTGYRSTNGSTWTQVASVNITMNTSVQIGLAVSSHADGTLSTATFSNVTVTP